MAHLLAIPENVMVLNLFPYLNHNDILRLRRVSKRTKAFADAYLWTPQPGHQGKWELKIDSSQTNKTLQTFLKLDLPPASRLHIANILENEPSEQRSFFENYHLEEFMERYSKYVTHLKIYKLFIPLTSSKEIRFYESLVNLKELRCTVIKTVGGATQFEEKTRNAQGSFLIQPIFKNLKILKVYDTDCMDSMYNFIHGVFSNLEELRHPIQRKIDDINCCVPVRQLIERRGMQSQTKLLYDWSFLCYMSLRDNYLEVLRTFASCRENGVLIKNLNARYLDCLLCDENGMIDIAEIVNPYTGEWMWSPRVNCQRNLFVGKLIHSLLGVTDNAFLMEMPALEKVSIFSINYPNRCQVYRRRGYGYPQWPNVRKMTVDLNHCTQALLYFLWGQGKRLKLEELRLNGGGAWRPELNQFDLPYSRDVINCCGNVKKLTLSQCLGEDGFFVGLWEGLPLLEDVTLDRCLKLTNNGFKGNQVGGSKPVFLELKKLKHFSIQYLDGMTAVTDEVFWTVFRHLKLSSFKMSSFRPIRSISLAGIKGLLTGQFAETIEKIDLNWVKLENVSKEELKEAVSCFRCSKLL